MVGNAEKHAQVDWTLTHIDDLELKHSHTDAVLLVRSFMSFSWSILGFRVLGFRV